MYFFLYESIFIFIKQDGQEVDSNILNFAVGSILLEQGHVQESFKYLNKTLMVRFNIKYNREFLLIGFKYLEFELL